MINHQTFPLLLQHYSTDEVELDFLNRCRFGGSEHSNERSPLYPLLLALYEHVSDGRERPLGVPATRLTLLPVSASHSPQRPS
jgi:hypothetical protein